MGIPQIGTGVAAPLAYRLSRNHVVENRRQSATSLIPRGRALFWEGEHQAHKIRVIEGVIRAVRLLENGNRQILTFYWPGDVVMPTQSSCQRITAEAVTNCRVQRTEVSAICQPSEPCGAHQVLAEALSLVISLSQKNSVARIAEFLLRIRRHLPEDPKRPLEFSLLLPRADIADHLGTSLETVCRTLAEFKTKGFIDLPNRKTIRFVNLPGLARVAGD